MAAFDSAIEIPAIPNTGKALADAMSKAQNLKLDKPEAVPMSPMDSMKLMFADMRDSLQQIAENTFKTTELLLGGTPKQQRDKGIKEGDVDAGPPPEKKGPGIFARMKGTLANLNPFKGGMSPLATFLLTGAALLGLKMFGEKAVGPLADFVKSIKEGTLIKKMKDIVESIKKDLEPWWKRIKENIVKFIAGTKIVFGLIEDAYNFVNDYIKQFDTDDKPGLSKKEKDRMLGDIKDRLGKALWALTGEMVTTLVSLLGFVSVAGIFSKLALVTAPLAAGTGGAAGGAVAGMSLFGVAAIAALVAAGIWKLADNSMTAWNDAITDEAGKPQDFSVKEFFARLLGGKNTKGGWMNAVNNAFDKALIGGAIGAGVGSALLTPGIGTTIGAITGFFLAGIGGFFLGDAGSDKINKFITKVGLGFDDLLDDMGSWFERTWTGIKNAITGNDEVYIDKNVEKKERQLETAIKQQKALEVEIAEEDDPDSWAYKRNLLLLESLKKSIERKKLELEMAKNPEYYTAKGTIQSVQEKLSDKRKDLKKHKDFIKDKDYKTAAGRSRQKLVSKLMVEISELELEELKLKKQMTDFKPDVVPNKIKEAMLKSPAHPSNFLFAPNHAKINSENTKGGDNVFTGGGLTSDNPHRTAILLAYNKLLSA